MYKRLEICFRINFYLTYVLLLQMLSAHIKTFLEDRTGNKITKTSILPLKALRCRLMTFKVERNKVLC